MKIRRSLLKDTVTVETFSGSGALGPVLAAAVTVSCHVDTTRRLVRASDGREVVSESTLFVHPDDTATFVPESRVTDGANVSTVISTNPQTFRGNEAFAKVALS